MAELSVILSSEEVFEITMNSIEPIYEVQVGAVVNVAEVTVIEPTLLSSTLIDDSTPAYNKTFSSQKMQQAMNSITESDPVFSASQASNITAGHITILNNTSGVNTGDQDLSGLATKTGSQVLSTTDALSVSGTTVTLHKGDGTTDSIITQDTIYTHPTADGNLHVPATGTTNSGKVLTAGATDGSMTWETPAGGGGVDVQTFTSSGTWTKPAGCTTVIVELFGAGGGGGKGLVGATSTVRCGGSGGGGGAYNRVILDASILGATESVLVGAGGIGATTTNGNSGGNSSFGTKAYSYGGGGGLLGTSGGTHAGGGGGGTMSAASTSTAGEPRITVANSMILQQFGGAKSFPTGATPANTSENSMYGGGCGGSCYSYAGTITAGKSIFGGNGGASGGGIDSANGIRSAVSAITNNNGTGGTGGVSSLGANGTNGGVGGGIASGGGGGAAAETGFTAGDGGAGANGKVIVYAW